MSVLSDGRLEQLLDRFPIGEDRNRTAGIIEEALGSVDAEAVIERGQQTVAVHDPLDRFFAAVVHDHPVPHMSTSNFNSPASTNSVLISGSNVSPFLVV